MVVHGGVPTPLWVSCLGVIAGVGLILTGAVKEGVVLTVLSLLLASPRLIRHLQRR